MTNARYVAARKEQGHLPALDGVRGLAILMVICSHAFASNSAQARPLLRGMGDLLGYGLFGVDLFFVLSGFLITGILVDSLEDHGFFRKFYARRMVRIFPLYYGVLAVLFALTPLLRLYWNGMGWLMLVYLQNLRPNEIGNYSPGAGLALNHFWSLAVEEQFYMIWPAAVFLLRDRRRILVTTLAVSVGALVLRLALVMAGTGANAIHVTTFTRADSLLLGGTLALLYRSRIWNTVMSWAAPGFILSALAVGVSIVLLPREFGEHAPFSRGARLWLDGFRYSVLALGSSSLIAWSLRDGSAAAWIFKQGWLRFLGKYSYGIYVLHMVPLGLLVGAQRAAIFRLTHSKLLAVTGAGFSTLALAVVAAYVSFHLYEKPFLRMKRFWDYVPKRMVPVTDPKSFPERRAESLVDSKSYISEVLHR